MPNEVKKIFKKFRLKKNFFKKRIKYLENKISELKLEKKKGERKITDLVVENRSLVPHIKCSEIKLKEKIGEGGFGEIWKGFKIFFY